MIGKCFGCFTGPVTDAMGSVGLGHKGSDTFMTDAPVRHGEGSLFSPAAAKWSRANTPIAPLKKTRRVRGGEAMTDVSAEVAREENQK